MSSEKEKLSNLFRGKPPMVEVKPEGWCLPSAHQKYAKDIEEFQFEKGDVIVMTMPKSGTTWTQEIVWTMMNNSNFEHPMAHLPLNIRTPILEVDSLIDHFPNRGSFAEMFSQKFPDFDQSHGMFLHVAKTAPRPRTLKTHLSFSLISDTALSKAKVVYVIRDPRDVCISYHHHCRIFKYEDFEGTFDQFVDAFLEGAVTYSPYWPHVKAAWERRHHPNLHVVFYEHMKKHPKEELHKLSKFLGLQISESQIEKIVEYTSFPKMKERDNHVVAEQDAPVMMHMELVGKEGGFFRQGMSGGWRKVLTKEQKDKFETWIEKNCPDKEIMKMILN
ncbi:Sulfotransferase domain, partial [Trinorchestia longiramus]